MTVMKQPGLKWLGLKHPGALLGVAALLAGGAMFYGASRIPRGFGYDAVGPDTFPRIIAAGVMISGGLCLLDAGRAAAAEAEAVAFGSLRVVVLISAALLAMAFGVRPLGWVPMAAVVFTAGAAAFGSRRLIRDAGIGLIIGLVTLLGFNLGLGLDLPLGPLAPLFG